MLEALGLKAAEARWKAAGKLQKNGKVTKKALLEYLEFGAQEICTVPSVELIARMQFEKKPQTAIQEMINTWQMQLIEHKGWEVNFGRQQLAAFIEGSGQAGKEGSDPKVVKAVQGFEEAIRKVVLIGKQEGDVRLKLALRSDGEDEHEGDTGALLPRRFPKKEGKMQVAAPVVRAKLEEVLVDTRSMVLSLRTREMLQEVLTDYSTWKQNALSELCAAVVIRWQGEVFEQHGIDRRLGILELAVPRTESPDVLKAQQGLMQACAGLTLWYSMRPKPAGLPSATGEGRRVEPWSRVEGAADTDERQLLQEGEPDPALVVNCLRGIRDEYQKDAFGDEVEEAAAAGDLMSGERWTRELYEAYGIHHDFGALAANAIAVNDEVEALNKELAETMQSKISSRVKAGLKRAVEAKKKAAAEKAAAEAEGASSK